MAGRLATSLGALNLVLMVAVAAVSATDSHWYAEESLPENALPVSTVARTVETKGFGRIVAVEVADGAYDVRAVDARGSRVRLSVDPVTGRIRRLS